MTIAQKPAVVILSHAGHDIGRKIALAIGGELHGAEARTSSADVLFDDTKAHIATLFAAGRPIVAVMACGALVRILAPLLSDKHAEPPVVAVSQDGASVVPLLGGHHGGNDLARRIADGLNCRAAITTAGDLKFGLALDEPPAGYVLANPENAKAVMAELVAGASAKLRGNASWLSSSRIPFAENGKVTLTVTDEPKTARSLELVYHPKTLVLGMGCERNASTEEAIALAEQALEESGLARQSLAAISSIDLKADERAIHAVAAHFGVPARFFSAARLEEEAPRLKNPSDIVFAEVGCHGVAEGAALAAAGADSELILAKIKSKGATAAIARSTGIVEADAVGRARGTLYVVGIGPGADQWRSSEVSAMVAASTDLVGYSLYLDLLGPLACGKVRHDFDLGKEEARVVHAMELAGEGRTVALVCSGDAGIYAMATLVFELFDKGGITDAASRIEVQVSPGISALQAAAARIGAPLGHDFCTISLSDLLTPWEHIQRRVKAAGEGDFVIAFYNPVSMKRRTQLAWARDKLLEYRPADTPVILATNLGRPGEHVRTVPLGELNVDDVDMLTVVVVGSSESRTVTTGDGKTWVYTPRGYSGKSDTGMKGAAEGGPDLHSFAAAQTSNTDKDDSMTVYFIGAGPGAPDLITVRGLRLIEQCPVCLYAGSLVPEETVRAAPEGAIIKDTAPMHLDEIIAEIEAAHARGEDVARVHSGDPSIYGAIAEQMRRLDTLGIPYDVVPGVPAFAATAARLKTELTLPEIAQTIIITRTEMKASSMPEFETLEILGKSRATLAIHLSIRNLGHVRDTLVPYYGEDCPVVVAYRSTWPDELFIRTTLKDMAEEVRKAKITRTALIMVGRVFGHVEFRDSDLYNSDFSHVLRNVGKKKKAVK